MDFPSPQKRPKVCTSIPESKPQLLLQLTTLLNTRETQKPKSKLRPTDDPIEGQHSKVGQTGQQNEGRYHLLAELLQHINQESHFQDDLSPVTEFSKVKPNHSSLLKYGTDVNSFGICKAGMSLLHHVASKNQRHLLRGQHLSSNDSSGGRGLGLRDDGDLVQRRETSMIDLLMEVGADVNIRKDEMSSCKSLHEAIQKIPNAVAQADPKSLQLQLALQGLHECLLKLLVNNEAEVNCREEEDCDPLHLIALQSHLKIARGLMKFGSETNSQSEGHHRHPHQHHLEIITPDLDDGDLVALLMATGSGVNSLCEKRRSLHCHFNQRLLHSLELLLFNGAGVNCFDKGELAKPLMRKLDD